MDSYQKHLCAKSFKQEYHLNKMFMNKDFYQTIQCTLFHIDHYWEFLFGIYKIFQSSFI